MNKQVLVIEDYADLRLAIGDALARGHYECDCVASAEDAILKLRTNHYAVILLSPHLPIADDRVIHFIRENQPGEAGKIILMTDPEVTEPPYGMLTKPFNKEQLLRSLPRR